MDVLSDTVTAMRSGRPHSARVSLTSPYGRSFPAAPGAGFHIVLQGSCWLFPAAPASTAAAPIRLQVGDVAFLPHGSAHGLADSPSTPLRDNSPALARVAAEPDRAGAPATVLLCGAYLLDRSRAHPLLDDLPAVVHLPTRVGRHEGLRTAVELLGGELERFRPGADAMITALLDVLLLQILRAWLAEPAGRAARWGTALGDPAVAAALRAIHDDPAHPWTVQELGHRAGLSRSAFARRFAALVGRPPLGYLTWWRMALAARGLRAGDAPLAALAREAGYGSEFAFAHAFKREFGLPPGEYRRTAVRSTPQATTTDDVLTIPGSG